MSDNSTEVIPSSWMITEDLAWWPSHLKKEKIIRLIRQCSEPNNSWDTFEISLRSTSNSFTSANLKADQLRDSSHVSESSSEEQTTTRKRKLPERFREESDQEDNNSQSIISSLKSKKYPCPKFPQKETSKKNESKRISTSNQDPELIGTEDNHRNQNSDAVSILFQRIITHIEDLKGKVERMSSDIKRMKESRNLDLDIVTLPEGITFPMKTDGELIAFNEKLKDSNLIGIMVNYLNDVAHGRTPRSFLLSIIKKVLSPDLAVQYSLYGRKGKKPFSDLRETLNVILAAAAKQFPSTRKEQWLEYFSRSLATSMDWVGRAPRPSDATEVPDTLLLTQMEDNGGI